jgi:hypothetical protein
MAKENRPLLRRQKGWPGFVHGYKKFIETVDWESIDWTNGEKPKEESRDKMGKIIQKW